MSDLIWLDVGSRMRFEHEQQSLLCATTMVTHHSLVGIESFGVTAKMRKYKTFRNGKLPE